MLSIGAGKHRGSILAYRPTAPGLSPSYGKFLSFLLSLWTVLRLDPSSAKQWISQILLVVTSRAKYYKKVYVFSITVCQNNRDSSINTKRKCTTCPTACMANVCSSIPKILQTFNKKFILGQWIKGETMSRKNSYHFEIFMFKTLQF